LRRTTLLVANNRSQEEKNMLNVAFRSCSLTILARAAIAALLIGLASPAAAITQKQVVASANREFGRAKWTVKIQGNTVKVSQLRLNTHSIKARPLFVRVVHRATLNARGQLDWK
jgi:hypothetical protein